ncbi:MAG: Gfo/Idh/MocA family oxidoreductase [Clostridia bacterium]|nr:Gfo/Idh/MocA family oxidoreductase [Clostridia bacterium]
MTQDKTNFAVVGLGGRGRGMLNEFLDIPDVRVVAVCDIYEDRALEGVRIVQEKTGETPQMTLDYHEILERGDVAAVLCFTTWITHARIAVDSMRAGKHVAIEVGGAASIEECWQMVRASEETGKYCMLLENCCYDRNEMALYNMVKLGLFGEVVHLEGGYRHDLRSEICLGRENRHGRLFNFMHRNGELYPTHQLGPICKLIGVNRGNRMLSLSSITSKSRGLNVWMRDTQGPDYDIAGYPFCEGDVTTTMIKCANGETITLHHDCSLPRPYSRDYVIEGTRGIFQENSRGGEIFLDTMGEKGKEPEWHEFPPVREKFEHPLWKKYTQEGVHGGHGGMDFLVMSAFAESVMEGHEPPIDVYDTAAWMAVTCLSEQSAAMGGLPVPIPDFTNGMWIDRAPYHRGIFCVDDVCGECFGSEENA